MTVTETGGQRTNQNWRGQEPLLCCLSRLILEPEWIDRRKPATNLLRPPAESAVISRAIIGETLSFRELEPGSVLLPGIPPQFAS